jgi:ATP-dependent DNA ligase
VPLLGRKPSPTAPAGPDAWLPQPLRSSGSRSVSNPLIEPQWSGARVLARAARGASGEMTVKLSGQDGEERTPEFAAVAEAIALAVLAEDAILDGYLTIEATQEGVGVMPAGLNAPTRGEMATQLLVGQRGRRPEPEPSLDADRPIAFVAVDLLRIDGLELIDLPLLERKRLLESALEAGDLVRVTPYVRAPLGSQGRTWFAQGFREVAYKPANGRYRADGKPGDWVVGPLRSS